MSFGNTSMHQDEDVVRLHGWQLYKELIMNEFLQQMPSINTIASFGLYTVAVVFICKAVYDVIKSMISGD